jgi:hypothetical protein
MFVISLLSKVLILYFPFNVKDKDSMQIALLFSLIHVLYVQNGET